MRRFLVLGHTQKAQAPVPLDDPAGAGRWDVLTRSVASGLLLSNGIRKDTEVLLFLLQARPPKTLAVRGDRVRQLNPDDRSIQGLLTKALALQPVAGHPMESSPGVSVTNGDLASVLDRAAEAPIVLLHEMGPLLESPEHLQPLRNSTFVLSDHQEFEPQELALVRSRARAVYSLGPLSLHTANCIAIVHHLIDRLPSE